MLIKLQKNAKPEALARLTAKLDSHGLHHCVSPTSDIIVGLEKPLSPQVIEELNSLGCISEVNPHHHPLETCFQGLQE